MAVLRDYIKVKHGFAFKGDHITTIDNGIVLVTPGNFSIGGGFKEEKCKFFDGEYPTDYVLKPGDLIVTMTDLSKAIDALGYSALVPKSKRIYLHNQRIGLVKIIDEERLDKNYLYWFMRTAYYQKTIAATSSGSTVHHTSPDRIMDVEIELPDLEKQRAVATFMGNIESKINTNKQINKNLEQQAQALFSNYYRQATTEVRFTDLIQVLGGGTPKTKENSYWNGDIPFFTPKDVGSPYTLSTEKTLTDIGLEHCNSRLFPVNTVFVTARGTVGKVALAGVPMAMNQSCYALAGKKIHSLLVYFYTLEAVEHLKHKASGAVFDAIITRDFDTESIYELSVNASNDFINKAEPIYQLILNNTIENQRLCTLRDSLLPKLMSGELDVSDLDL